MVIGGWTIESYTDEIELVSPDPMIVIPECLTNHNSFPFGTINGGAGASVTASKSASLVLINVFISTKISFLSKDGIPLICGGCIGSPGTSSCKPTDKCYEYVPQTQTWEETTGSMSGIKEYHASDYTFSSGLVMAHEKNPTEVTMDGVFFEQLADYPNPDVTAFDAGCLVVIDENTFFLAGGNPNSNRAFIYTKGNDSWREVHTMNTARNDHSCGIVDSYIRVGKDIIVAGGTCESPTGGSVSCGSVEIFSINDESWYQGNLL